MSKHSFVELENARNSEQLETMKKILARGECPFCQENITKSMVMPPLFEDEYWYVNENQWPYDNTKHQFLLMYKSHAERLGDITPQAGIALIKNLQRLETEYGVNSGALFLRFGDPKFNGASVRHLHFQFLVPDVGHNKNWGKIKVKLGTNPK
jgi:diadenosine tetraphosphate (Ap4A) HIT family hydrolase